MSSGSNGEIGQVLGVVVGVVVGYVTENTQLGFAAYSVTAGVSTLLLAGKGKAVNGPLLADLSVQLSAEGTPNPIIFGRMRVAGNIVWGTQKIPHSKTSGGGKGSSTPSTTTTTYTQSVAIKFCRGTMGGYGRMWFDKKLLIDFSHAADAASIIASDFLAASIRFYPGTGDQLPDPLIVSYEGVGNSTARRGDCYIVFEDLQIDSFGERIPQIEVELFGASDASTVNVNICSLTPADQGQSTDRGRSWISDSEIYYWRRYSTSDSSKLALYHSTDGQEGLFVGVLTVPASIEAFPVNTRSVPWIESVGSAFNPTANVFDQTLHLVRIDTGSTEDTVRSFDRVLHFLPAVGGDLSYYEATDAYRMTALDEDTGAIAFALKSTNHRYYGQRISIFAGALPLEYSVRSTDTGYPECEALACNNGYVYAIVYDGAVMRLWIINQEDGSLVSDFAGPPVAPPSGTDIVASIRVDGSTVYGYSVNTVWKWYGDGTFIVLSENVFFRNDGGGVTSALGGQRVYIGEDHVIVQGEVFWNGDSAHPIFKHELIRFNAPDPNDVSLASIVTSLCTSVGVPCDASELEAIMVSGFVVSRQMSAAEALNYLAAVYYFDGVPTNTGVRFKLRGGASVMTIHVDDLAAHDFGAESPDALTESRDKEIDIPQYFAVNYTNVENDYLQGSVPALRLNTYSQQVATLDATAIAMTPSQAAQLAETAKITSWIERTKNTFSGDYRLKALQKSDVVMIDDGRVLRRRRITSVKDQQGLMQFECVADDASAYGSTRVASGATSSSAIKAPIASDIALLDIAPLQDSDVGPMLYAKVTPRLPAAVTTSWSGASLIRVDDGSNETEGSVHGRSIVGATLDVLGAWNGIGAFDEGNSFTAALRGGGSPASLTRAVALLERSAWLVGEEVIIARDITLVSGNNYRFSGLRRYLRGTENAAAHALGDRVVFLEKSDMLSITDDAAKPGAFRVFSAVSTGRKIESGITASIVSADHFRKCFAPTNVRAAVGQDAIYLTWNRRTRLLSPDTFSPGFRSDEQDEYLIKTEMWTLASANESIPYDNLRRYFAQLRGESTDFTVRVAQVLLDGTVGEYSEPLLVHGGDAPNPKTTLFISTTAPDGTTTFTNSGGAGIDVSTAGAVHVTANRAVFAGGSDAIICGPLLPEQLFGLGIGVFEIRMKFKTTSTGVLMSHTTPAFDQGSWRLMVEDIGPFPGIVTFYLSDFTAFGALLQSGSSFGNFRDGVEHEVRIYQGSATGNVWVMVLDGVAVTANGWRNKVAGSFTGVAISIGNDPNYPGHGFVGTIGDPGINLFPGL